MTKNKRFGIGTLCTLLLGAGTSHAALIDRGGGLIYDDVLNITWMQDAGYARTAGYAERMNWAEAVAFAGNLEYFDKERGVTWDDWRLPSTINAHTSIGWDTTGQSSELAYMYYVNLGYAANTSMDRFDPAPTSSNYNPFINLAYRGFWSGTASNYIDRAWSLHFHFGMQDLNGVNDGMRIWLVRDGDVAGAMPNTTVPEPGTLALFGLALVGLGLARRNKVA